MSGRTRLALRAAVSAGLVAFFATHIDLGPIQAALARTDGGGLALAVLVVLVLVAAASALRWLAVCRALDLAMDIRRSLELVYIGWFFNQLLPSGVGGDVVRAVRTRALGIDWSRAVHCVLLDRLLALAAMVLIVAAGWQFIPSLHADAPARHGVLVLLGAVVFAFSLLLVADKLPLPASNRLLAAVVGIAASTRAVLLTRFAAPALLASVVTHLVTALAAWLIARALGLQVTLAATCVLIPLVLFVMMLPISIGGWGVREGAMIAAFGYVGVEPASAFAMSVLFGLSFVAASLPGALLWLRDPVRE